MNILTTIREFVDDLWFSFQIARTRRETARLVESHDRTIEGIAKLRAEIRAASDRVNPCHATGLGAYAQEVAKGEVEYILVGKCTFPPMIRVPIPDGNEPPPPIAGNS